MAEQSQAATVAALREGSAYLNADLFRQGATLALLMGKHMLTVGPPGHNKTEFAAELFRSLDLDESQYHVISGYKGAGEEILVNYLDPRKMEEGKLEFLPGKSLLNVVLAYVDEVGALSRVAQQALLQIMQSRRFSRAGMDYNLPLDTLFAGGNSAPEDPAVRDRFAIQVPTELPNEHMPGLVTWADNKPTLGQKGGISWANVLALRSRVQAARLTEEAKSFVVEIAGKFQLSPRRVVEALVPASKAWAVQENRKNVTPEDVLAATPYVVMVHGDLTLARLAQVEQELEGMRDKVKLKEWALGIKRQVAAYQKVVMNANSEDEAALLQIIRDGNELLCNLPHPDRIQDQKQAEFVTTQRQVVTEAIRLCMNALRI